MHDKRFHHNDELAEHEQDELEQADLELDEQEQAIIASIQKDKLVLGYMLEHNKQHAKELVELAIKLENRGLHDTATIILNAVYDFERGNDKLEAAINTI